MRQLSSSTHGAVEACLRSKLKLMWRRLLRVALVCFGGLDWSHHTHRRLGSYHFYELFEYPVSRTNLGKRNAHSSPSSIAGHARVCRLLRDDNDDGERQQRRRRYEATVAQAGEGVTMRTTWIEHCQEALECKRTWTLGGAATVCLTLPGELRLERIVCLTAGTDGLSVACSNG